MTVKQVSVPTTAQSLLKVLDTNELLPKRVNSLILQAPEGNAATVYIGSSDIQPFELYAGTAAPFAITRLDQIFIKGTSGDTLNVVLM